MHKSMDPRLIKKNTQTVCCSWTLRNAESRNSNLPTKRRSVRQGGVGSDKAMRLLLINLPKATAPEASGRRVTLLVIITDIEIIANIEEI